MTTSLVIISNTTSLVVINGNAAEQEIDCRNHLAEVRDMQVSERTIRKYLNAIPLMARRLEHGPELIKHYSQNTCIILCTYSLEFRTVKQSTFHRWVAILLTSFRCFSLNLKEAGERYSNYNIFPMISHSMVVRLQSTQLTSVSAKLNGLQVSFELNPIKHVLDIKERQVKARNFASAILAAFLF